MKKLLLPITVILLALGSCTNSNSFGITNDTVGGLTKTTTISELKKLYANDSLVDDSGATDFRSPQGNITVYEKGGKELLKLTPTKNGTDATIKYIQVLDERYVTSEGVALTSTFKDIQDNYEIRRIENLIGAVVIFVENSDVYFTIDKKNLPADLMFDTKSKIELSQIPDEAPIKYLQIGWE